MHARNIAIVLAAVLSQISALAQRLPPDLSSEEQEEIDTQGRLLLSSLEPYQHGESEIVFLVDSSGSIGASNFHFEINFIREISTIFSMSPDEARVSVVTYSDSSKIVRQIDYIGSSVGKNKCTFLGELSLIRYEAGWTDTKGALEEADRVLQHARSGANRLVVLLTDGQSTEGDPVGIATRIRNKGIRIVAIGVGNVNMDELTSIATAQYVFILDRLSYVVDLATRIKNDVKEKSWDMSVLESSCNYLCTDGNDCCDDKARCSCGTSSGTHQCACQAGYSGNGLNGQCTACPRGTYKQMVGNLDCVACPDNSNTEDTGSVSIDQCRCNAGYIERPDHSCSIVTCARLTAPPGGYIMPNPCANTFGSSCEFKCSSNYRPMPGGSHRIECLENGQWSGQPFICRKITCEALSEPSNGNLLCDTDDNSIDTWCTFTCNHGYDILGSEDTRCVLEEGGNERWTDAEPKCKIRSCQPLEVKKNMRLRPSACEETNIPYMEVCVYSCKDGYMLHGAETSECQADGEWSNVNVERFCKDNEPPKFLNCPSDVTVTAELHMSKGKLTWEEPTATDNSGIAPSITMIPNIQGPPFWFPIGESTVTYIAMDGEHLVDECRFIVTVIDEESPSVLTCPGDIEIQSASRSSNVTWIEPTFQDNSGEDVTVYMNRQPGSTFYWGSSSVTYEAVDWTGNTALCKFEVNLKQHNCEHASPPENGSLSCENWLGGQFCMVSCQVKYDFVFDPEDIYYCKQNRITHKGEWAPAPIVSRGDRDFKFPWPDCARMTEPSKLSLGLAVQYYVDNCFGETGKEEIRRNFITKFQQLEQQASGFCLDERCAVENIAVYCGPSSSTSSVHKRDVSRNVIRVSYTLIVETQPDSPDSTDTDGGSEESTADGQPALRPIDMLRQLKNEVQVTASRGLFRAIITNTGINTVPSDEPELIEESNVVVECPVGHIWRNDSCLTCPIGTYHDVTTNTCTACAIGMYQDTEASTYCQQCPPNTLTTKTRSKTISACVGFCQPGTFSKTGLETCILCPRGSYQPNNGSTSCISCEENLSTWTDGAVSADYCKVGCISGSYSETGFMPCIPCQRGTYQPRGSQKSCIPCEDGKTTHFQGAHAIQYCQVIDLCELFPCQHNATCVSMNETRQCQCIPGYGGESCEINIDDCEEDLCKNNGTCVDGVDDYHCICQIGFTGANCQINIDECKSSPCLNGASCYDRSSGYMCKCLDGYTGAQCEINYFDCASSPCKNGGTCFDLAQNFTCCCPPGYAGRFCEEEVNECQSSPCQNGGLCISGLGNYTCECLSGFIGEDCDVNIDECASYPCSNGGTCIDLIDSYFCECDISYLGDNCETFISTDFNLLFTSSQATDYASIDRVSDMYECTISFWMKTSDSSSYGTPISYAQSSDGAVTDNALTLQDYNNFVLYINDDPVYTNLKANGDSDWHHVAVTWESDTGSWAVYFDNVYVRGGVSFQQAAVIRGGGILVIGQDQDSVGGQFNAAECFVGELSQASMNIGICLGISSK
uniref:Sushi, von Willebrand factor type A, EGF and pentraxin domain-containing protein 1-like n=1 Tax=Saccoglossus kowalevskii TaxID=10224 RepID=A0ABM0M9B8_SACKO|nr:PREDICTED: sushi, von Willebrand factor type A, EGF and pentraxin domain-containing protein 1-like [Saccoglossus kowalevskii]